MAKKRGFAAMSAEKQREIASKGGKAAHEQGTAHTFSVEEARAAGSKGGKSNAKRVEAERVKRRAADGPPPSEAPQTKPEG